MPLDRDPIRQFIAHHSAVCVLAVIGGVSELIVAAIRALGW